MAQAYIRKLDEVLYQDSKLTPYFEQLEAKTGVKRTYYALGLAAFLLLYIVFGYGGDLLCNLIGFVFPAYKSIKAIESEDKNDDTQVRKLTCDFAQLVVIVHINYKNCNKNFGCKLMGLSEIIDGKICQKQTI